MSAGDIQSLIDVSLETSRAMEIDEIIEFVVNPAPVPSAVLSDGNESEDEDEFEPPVSSKDAIPAVKTLKTFLDQNSHQIPSLDDGNGA